MNAAVLAYGYTVDGVKGAKAALENFWRRVSEAARIGPIQRAPLDIFMGNWTLDNSPGYVLMRDLLEESIDFELLKQSSIKFFVTATNVRTGLPRVFRNEQMHADVLLASACLPLMHRAVEIDGDAHWDGGFSGNSLLTPIVRESPARDTLLVQINRIERLGVPEDSARYPQPPERDLFN